MKKLLVISVALLMTLCILASCEELKNDDSIQNDENPNGSIQNDENPNDENKEKPTYDIKDENTPELKFKLNEDGKSYTVVGIGTYTANK